MVANVDYTYLINMQWKDYFVYMLNTVLPYGMLFWVIAIMLYFVLYNKTRNFAFPSAVVSIYFIVVSYTGLVTNAVSSLAMRYFGIGMGLIVGLYLYTAVKS